MSFMSNNTSAYGNKLYLNSTLNDDDFTSQISINAVMMDDLDQAIMKCIEQHSCFKNLNIEKVKKGVYKLEKKEY